MIGDSNDKTNFPHIILLTDIQVSRIRKAFASNLSPNIELSEIQLFKVVQSGVFLSKFIGPLLKTGSPLMKNLLKPLAKSIFIPIGLKAAASAADRNIQFGLMIKCTSEIIKNEAKEQKVDFLACYQVH